MFWIGCANAFWNNVTKGVTVAQMHEVLKARGIEIGERSLKLFLEKGELPGRKSCGKRCASGDAANRVTIRFEYMGEDIHRGA